MLFLTPRWEWCFLMIHRIVRMAGLTFIFFYLKQLVPPSGEYIFQLPSPTALVLIVFSIVALLVVVVSSVSQLVSTKKSAQH